MDTDDSQDSRGREGTVFYSTVPLPPAHEHSDNQDHGQLLPSTAWKVSKYRVISGPLFSCIRIEYGDLWSKSPYSIWTQENTDKK